MTGEEGERIRKIAQEAEREATAALDIPIPRRPFAVPRSANRDREAPGTLSIDFDFTWGVGWRITCDVPDTKDPEQMRKSIVSVLVGQYRERMDKYRYWEEAQKAHARRQLG